jgi:hypothetical protein
MQISQRNFGRIAERIVANELEARGFRVSDLNRDGTVANADLLAVAPILTLQVQVKGASNTDTDPWWLEYRFCTREIIDDRNQTTFNRRTSYYKADLVVLVAVRSPREYSCVVLPVAEAERAAQLNLDHDYRTSRVEESLKSHIRSGLPLSRAAVLGPAMRA